MAAGDTLVFAQGQTATITAQFVTSPAGMPVDVPDATIEIFGSGGDVLPPTPMLRADVGFYYYNYAVPNSLPPNTYTIRITGTVLGTPTAMTAYLMIVLAGTPTPVTSSQTAAALIAELETYIGMAQRIPVKRELANRDATNTVYSFTWPRWNLGNNKIWLNNRQVTTGYTADLNTGVVTFDKPLDDTDKVEASYNWRYFTMQDEVTFLHDALTQINLEPPGTNFTIDNVTDPYFGVLIMGATKNAIKRLLFDLIFQEPATIYGSPERTQQVVSQLQSLKENNEKEFATDKKQIKKAKYPAIASVVQPEYTLPGGRSRWFRYLFSNNIG